MNYMTKLNVFRDVERFLRYNFYALKIFVYCLKGLCIGDNVIDTSTFII